MKLISSARISTGTVAFRAWRGSFVSRLTMCVVDGPRNVTLELDDRGIKELKAALAAAEKHNKEGA